MQNKRVACGGGDRLFLCSGTVAEWNDENYPIRIVCYTKTFEISVQIPTRTSLTVKNTMLVKTMKLNKMWNRE